ncbi:MAG TPA: flagellar biosynthesis protein FlhF [Methylotenera sp.]|nr:flagellar biosynthesis protein FlhF [Methylotenera sp.]HPH04945.1 flagellar biosynthesis protein FlhF [Methylotenera sp.]HPN02203.1 flagellar biosynthesis protein FlhF [Methylotenera sp.]
MNLKRFFGKNSREALNMVRRALGENAVIISNRAFEGGNEIIAVKEEEMHAMAVDGLVNDYPVQNMQSPIEKQMQEEFSNATRSEPMTLLEMLQQKNQQVMPNLAQQSAEMINQQPEPRVQAAQVKHAEPSKSLQSGIQQASASSEANISNQEITQILSEMRSMRSALESQLTTLSWAGIQQHDPIKAQVLSTLLSAGFSAALSRKLAEKLPANIDYSQAIAWLKSVLSKNLSALEDESEMLQQGGVFALIGPTGVGKTTTVAKLAARYVMKYGTQNLGLITTDAYRIGGHEQLRIYGKILGVMVHSVKDEADLKIALNELKGKHTVLIDTVGMSQRDQMVNEQIAMLSNTQTPIKRLLCLNATSTGETLANVIKAYKGRGLEGCIMTKIDEAATIGNGLDAIIRERLKLYYVTNGQRVPEDILIANKQHLIQEALNHESLQYLPYKYLADELPIVMANTVGNSNNYAEVQYA